MTNAKELLIKAVQQNASDLFIVTGLPATMRINNSMVKAGEEKMMPPETEQFLEEIYAMAERPMNN